MIFKEFRSEDLEQYYSEIMELLVETYRGNFKLPEDQAKLLCEEKLYLLSDYLYKDSAIVIAAINENELIGFTWLYKHDFFGEKRLHINQIAVTTKFRGNGIGKKLIQEAEKQALKEDIKIIDLFVSETNSSAFNLYERLGFETERRYMKKEL